MKTSFRFLSALLLAGLFSLTLGGCFRNDFDEPPGEGVVDITPTATIEQLKGLHSMGAYELIAEDWVIKGVVTMDDESGNFYKTIVIEDATAGIDVKINATGLYNDYPVGRTIYIKTKGLYLGDYNNQIQLGGSTYNDANGNPRLGGIEQTLMDTYIIKGNTGGAPVAQVLTIDQINANKYSMLVTLNDVQFTDADAGQTFADGNTQFSLNRIVEDCNGNSIILRSSGYASFANDLTPNLKGSITGVLSVFGSDIQLFIRDPSDIVMDQVRCDGGGTGGNSTPITIGDLRAVFTGAATTAPADKYIEGVVISDKDNSNITSKNMVIQGDDGKGIAVRFTAANTFALGERVKIEVGGLEISEYNGLLQLNNVANSKGTSLGAGTLPTPTVLTIAQLLAQSNDQYESTLVKISGVTLTSTGTTYADFPTADDGTGTLLMYSTSYATFAATNFPTGVVNITAIASQGGTNSDIQINIRNTNDIQ